MYGFLKLLSLKKPDPETLRTEAGDQEFGFASAINSFEAARGLFIKDSRSVLIGRGEETFNKALELVYGLEMFNLPGRGFAVCAGALSPGNVVSVAARVGFVWFKLSSFVSEHCDINTAGGLCRGFAYVTSHNHVEFGKEWFEVTYNAESKEVYFNLKSLSRPAAWYLYPLLPVLRYYQVMFQKGALRAIRIAVSGPAYRDA